MLQNETPETCWFSTFLNCGICVLEYTDTYTLVDANDACYELYGYTREQFADEKGNSPVTLIHPDDKAAFRDILERNRKAGDRYFSLEFRSVRRDGTEIWVENRMTLLKQNGRQVILCLIWDITEKKNLEEEVALSVQRYKIALSKSHNLIWEYHLDEDTAYIENTAGSPFQEKKVVRDFSRQAFDDGFVDRDYLPAYQQMFQQLRSGKTIVSALLRGKRADGSVSWHRITHTLLKDRENAGNIAIGVAEDVSKEQQALERYRNEEKYRYALVGNALASYEIDIDGDRILEKVLEKDRDMLEAIGLDVGCKYSVFLENWAEKRVHAEDRLMFLRELNIETLKKQYEAGKQEVVCEYRTINADDKMIWCRTKIYLITSDLHLNGFVYVKNIEEVKAKELELLRQSRIDPLTGLLNRGASITEINRLLAENERKNSALLIIDVDNFKAVNDTYGHMYGDKVLADTAYKLTNIMGSQMVVGRLGGDEFLVFMPDVGDGLSVYEKARVVARELYSAQQEEQSVKISNSIGIAFYPRHGRIFHELYGKADIALRHAKQSGKSCYSVYGDEVSEVDRMDYVNREWLIDELEEIVYLSDIEDYTLLYVNRAGRELTGIKMGEFEQNKCYKLLQGRDTPCPFCTNAKLNKKEFYTWEFENPHFHKNFIVKDKLVDWNGKSVRMEIAVDVGDRIKNATDITSKYYMEQMMLESLRALSGAPNLEEAIEKTLELITEFYDGERAYIMEIDREHGFAYNSYEWCREGIPPQKPFLQNIALESIPYVFETFDKKQRLFIPEVEELRHSYPNEYRFLSSRKAHSLFAVPFDDEESYSGYVGVDNPHMNQDTIRFLDSIAYNIANEIKKRRLYEQLEYEAKHDTLSGLYNRGSYIKYRETLQKQQGKSCGVVTADINGLKQLNRDYGHERGDETIIAAAEIMTGCFPKGQVFRVSGDEFVIIAMGLTYEEFTARVNDMRHKMDLQTPDGVSVGNTWAEQPGDFEALLRHAEERMLVNKQLYYKNSDDMRKHYLPEMVKNLTKEVDEGYYRIYLQPKFNSSTGEILSAEALARYQAPGVAVKPPGRFVPLLEKMKIVRHLDFYMLAEVCRLLAKWKAEGSPMVPVSVNFSRITLLESDLFDMIAGIQEKYDIPYNLITIEITESAGDMEHKVMSAITSRLREAGFKLSLDDFGADYANMSLLSIIHFDEVKLDKSLIDNLAKSEVNQTVVRCIVDMCRSLHVECVAEGVETKSQLELLRSFGCKIIQGYYYSRPLEEYEFEEKLAGFKISAGQKGETTC